MQRSCSQGWGFLYLLGWYLNSVFPDAVPGSSSSQVPADIRSTTLQTTPEHNISDPLLCPAVLLKSEGTLNVAEETGRSVGSFITFQCQEGYHLIGNHKLRCFLNGYTPQWDNQLPYCDGMPQSSHKGIRLAIIVFLVSCLIIITLSATFTMCCVWDRQLSLQEQETYFRDKEDDQGLGISREYQPHIGEGNPPDSYPHETPALSLLSSACSRGTVAFDNRRFCSDQEEHQRSSLQDGWPRTHLSLLQTTCSLPTGHRPWEITANP